MSRRIRVFRSACCGVTSEVRRRHPGEPISLAFCQKCKMRYDSSGINSWLQDLEILPLGSLIEVKP